MLLLLQNDAPLAASLGNYVFNHQLPTAYPCDQYRLYENTVLLMGCPGVHASIWDQRVRTMLLTAQRLDAGCFAGSWDVGANTFIGSEYGRLLATELNVLTLEEFHRHDAQR